MSSISVNVSRCLPSRKWCDLHTIRGRLTSSMQDWSRTFTATEATTRPSRTVTISHPRWSAFSATTLVTIWTIWLVKTEKALLTVRFACYRHALRYIEKEYLSGYKTISIEECSPADASIDFETQYEIEDYTKVDTIIHQMRLTIAETETLNYYMAGLGFVEIAQMQNVNNTTVWRRRKSIQKKYLRYVVMQGWFNS